VDLPPQEEEDREDLLGEGLQAVGVEDPGDTAAAVGVALAAAVGGAEYLLLQVGQVWVARAQQALTAASETRTSWTQERTDQRKAC
jgi:hypothetical protein